MSSKRGKGNFKFIPKAKPLSDKQKEALINKYRAKEEAHRIFNRVIDKAIDIGQFRNGLFNDTKR